MRIAALLLTIVWLLAACAPGARTVSDATTRPIATTPPGARAQGTWRGTAENPKVGAFLSGPDVYVELPDIYWPEPVLGRTVEVQGTVVERHDLPVFIADPDGPVVGGIPVPPGTNLHEAAKRLVLERVTWKLVGDGQ